MARHTLCLCTLCAEHGSAETAKRSRVCVECAAGQHNAHVDASLPIERSWKNARE